MPEEATDTLRTESLDYLFTPADGNGKKAYSDVTGLLQMDDQVYYYYDSKRNFAEFDERANEFILYDSGAIDANGGSPTGRK